MKSDRLLWLLVVLVLCAVIWFAAKPSNQRDWSADQARMPSADIEGDTIVLHDIRDNTYRSETDFDQHYHDRVIRLSDVQSVWYVVDQLGGWTGAAHTFLSFGLKDGTYLSVSVEARREKNEKYSIVQGALKQYELLYVLADEQDAVGLRAVTRNHPVWLYRLALDPDQSAQVFLSAVRRMNTLVAAPEFYNTLTNACGNNAMLHLRAASGVSIPFSWKIIAAGYSDEMLYQDGLIKSPLPFPQLKAASRINDAAKKAAADHLDFSRTVRAGLPAGQAS